MDFNKYLTLTSPPTSRLAGRLEKKEQVLRRFHGGEHNQERFSSALSSDLGVDQKVKE